MSVRLDCACSIQTDGMAQIKSQWTQSNKLTKKCRIWCLTLSAIFLTLLSLSCVSRCSLSSCFSNYSLYSFSACIDKRCRSQLRTGVGIRKKFSALRLMGPQEVHRALALGS